MSDPGSKVFVVDSNFFFRSYHDTYPPNVFPGFWRFVEHGIRNGDIGILDHVRNEVKSPEYLTDMRARHQASIISSGTASVGKWFGELVNLVQADRQFTDVAKARFRQVADGWIIAYALDTGSVVVTHEKLSPEAKNRIPMPNLCVATNVTWMDTVGMLRELGVEFELK